MKIKIVYVALIADVRTIHMLLYALETDVLKAMSLAKRGRDAANRFVLQLQDRDRLPHYKRDIRRVAKEKHKYYNKVLNVWVAEFHTEWSLRLTEIILLLAKLNAKMGGIITEIVVKE